ASRGIERDRGAAATILVVRAQHFVEFAVRLASTSGGVAGLARALLSCCAKLKSHAPVARISKPIVLNGVGMSRCATPSTNPIEPPGLRITSTIKASVVVANSAIARSSCVSAVVLLGGDIDGIRR